MKKYMKPTRFSRAIQAGAAIGATIFATSALQAQQDAPPTTPPSTTPPSTAAPQTAGSEPLSHRGKEFIKDAGQGNQFEISLADDADLQSDNSQVKELAQQLRDDHRQNNEELRALASAHGYALENKLDFINQHIVDHLRDVDKAKFDKEYAVEMLKTHVKAIKEFQKAGQDLEEGDIKQFAASTLPKLRMHLKHSEDVARAVGVDESKISSIVKGVEVTATDSSTGNPIAEH